MKYVLGYYSTNAIDFYTNSNLLWFIISQQGPGVNAQNHDVI